jgi:hypothetical protein
VGSAELSASIASFKLDLTRTEAWLKVYAANPRLTAAEIRTAQLIEQYIAAARRYCAGPKVREAKLDHFRQKVERACWILDKRWLESGRHFA